MLNFFRQKSEYRSRLIGGWPSARTGRVKRERECEREEEIVQEIDREREGERKGERQGKIDRERERARQNKKTRWELGGDIDAQK